MIAEALDKMMEGRRRVFPCRGNRASNFDVCERKMVYSITNWQDKTLPSLDLQYIFDAGNVWERATVRRLEEAGVEIEQRQRDFEYQGITAHIDGMVRVDGKPYPIEIKSMSQYIWEQINTVEDMTKSDKSYLRKYPAQLQLYLLMSNAEKGCFVLVNKQTSRVKEIWMTLDYAYCEELLKKAERVDCHVDAGTLPDRIPYDPDMCDRCDFAHICLPPVENRDSLYLEQSAEIEQTLKNREVVAEASKAYAALDKTVKEWAKKISQPFILCGDFLIKKKPSKDGVIMVSIEKAGEAKE